jgi:outer membrane receptor protein involved in Fe transport
MNVFKQWFVLAGILVLCAAAPVNAQNSSKSGNTITFSGTVYAAPEQAGSSATWGSPLAYAVVNLPEVGVSTITNAEGKFILSLKNGGTYKVEITTLGYEPIALSVVLPEKAPYTFTMKPASFYLDDVVVSAESKRTGASTTTSISKTAMDHIQATSLADVMSLLPGAAVRTSEELRMQSAGFFGVRNGSTDTEETARQSFGTAVIMDGAPISNNANMQTVTAALNTDSPDGTGFIKRANPGTGVDMRTITTNNIESVDVIRGIAGAQYGDIASGAVIVNSKAGYQPFTLQMDINPNVYMLSASHGVALGEKAGFLNYGLDYTFSQYDLREGYDTYNRGTGRLAYSNTVGKWTTNTSFNIYRTAQLREPNPDDENDVRTDNQKDLGLRFNTNGRFDFNQGWFKNIKYAASLSYTDKHTFYENAASNADVTYSTSKTDGAIISSFPGLDLSDAEGNKITNIPDADKDGKVWILPSNYKYNYDMYGKELNTYAQVSALFSGQVGALRLRSVVGADYRNSGNLGRGKVFDPSTPPWRSVSYEFATQRERPFNEVPFMHQMGLFLDQTFMVDIFGRRFQVDAGVRYDKVSKLKGKVAPRLNASYDVLNDNLSIRGGYGITYKAPSLGYLYPDNAYFDILNFNNAPSSKYSDAQKFQIATTRVFSTENPDLEMSKTTKWEVGADFRIGQIRGSVTYFEDKSYNGFMLGKTLNTFKSVDYVQYQAADPVDATTLPELSVASKDKILLSYNTPTNYFAYESKGIEFDIDFGRIDAIRTSFGLNGSWTRYKSWKNYYTFKNRPGGSTVAQKYPDMGVYEPGNTVTNQDRIATNLRVTHNIPRLGFVVTMTANVTWREYYGAGYNTYGNDSIPVKYISRLDGSVHDIANPTAFIDDPANVNLDIRPDLQARRLIKDAPMSPVVCFNINVTKEIGDFMRISFFANNMFRSTPLWEDPNSPGTFRRRNEDLFFFGAALTFKIK